MYFLPIVLFLLGANAGSDNGVCQTPWRKGDDSCYLVNTTAVSRYVAWTSCIEADDSSSLVVIETNEENNVVGLLADGENLQEFWTSGTRNGWETWDFDNQVSVFVEYQFENWFSGSRDGAGWTTEGKNGLFVSDAVNAREWNMQYTTDNELYHYGFICEIPLDTCYTGLATTRDTWQRTNIGDTATMACPTTYNDVASVYTGDQTRECNAQAQFLTPVTTTCAAVVDENGWTDDTTSDGFAWTDSALINGDRHGPYRHTTSNSKLFNTASADVANFPYVFISMDVTIENGNGFDGTLQIAIEGDDGAGGTATATLHTEAFSDSETITAIMPRTAFGADTQFSLHLTANMDGEDASTSTKEFYITNLYMEAYSRQDMSEECYRKHSFNESIANPVFVQANSGFMSTDDDLTIEFTIPRELYDITIAWENQPGGNPEVGYTPATGVDGSSLWGSEMTTASKCGRETWSAAIPWTSLTGAFDSVTTFNDGTSDVTNDGESYYVFTAVLRVDASEKTVAYNPVAARDWEQTRTATWRYPLALKWLRDVDVTTTVGVFVCADGATICTIRHVAAIVSFVQTEVDPIAALSNDNAGVVVLGILTKVAYPYMFVSGEASDDPPNTDNQNIDGADTDYTTANSLYENWAPPLVVAAPAIVDTVQQAVSTAMAFQWEDTTSCSHDASQAVEFQTTKECEQTWTLQITPTGGSCYVNGDYTISFSARCMYNKPVCVFLQNQAGKYQNGVSTTLTVKSTQMCPSLVEDVDLSGSLCSTGRSQDSMGYTTGCDPDATYVQGEVTHFYTEVSSSIAAIQKTEIINIYATQDFSSWLGAPNNLLPRYDDSYDGKVSIWAEGDAIPAVNTFAPDDGGVTVGDAYLQTVAEVVNSDQSEDFASNQAGFQVNLNPYIFPAPHDRSTDVTFTVLLRVTYEGFEDFAGTTGVLSGDTFGGSNDASWCASTLAGTYGGSTTEFCAGHPGAASACPDTCVRRQLRRALQSTTPINGGDDFMQLTTTVTLSPAKAEINGYVDDDTVDVRFTLLMEVDDEHIDLFNVDRPLYYSRMEYKIASLASAIDGQVHCSSIMRIVRGDRQALQVVVDIQQLEGVTDSSLSPAAIAQNLEMMIQTGRIYHDDFFLKTEVYSMQYEAVDESPDKVHFGEVSPVDTAVDYQPDSASTLSVLLVCLISLFMW